MSEHPSELLLQRLGGGETLPEDPTRDQHLEACAACTETIAAWAQLVHDLDALPAADPGPEFSAAVLVRLPEAGSEGVATGDPMAAPLRPWALGVLALSLAAGLLAALGLDFLIDLPALVGRGLGAASTVVASALAVADSLTAALPEGTSLGLLVAELLFFLGLAHLARPMLALSLPESEETSP